MNAQRATAAAGMLDLAKEVKNASTAAALERQAAWVLTAKPEGLTAGARKLESAGARPALQAHLDRIALRLRMAAAGIDVAGG